MLSNRLIRIALTVCVLAALTGCGSTSGSGTSSDFANLPAQGNVANGEQIFLHGKADAPSCTSCHHTDSSTSIGPGLGGIADRAASRVSGQAAREYIYTSIVSPAKFIVPGFSNQMYSQYGSKLSSVDIADVMAYVITLTP